MASVHEYKKLEDSIVKETKKAGASVGLVFLGALKGAGKFLTRRYTVVFVPHSEKKLYNLHVSVLSVFCFFIILFGVAGGFVMYGLSQGNNRYIIQDQSSQIASMETALEQLRGEVAALVREAEGLGDVFSGALVAMGPEMGGAAALATAASPFGRDLGAFINVAGVHEIVAQEVGDLRLIAQHLGRAAPARETSVVQQADDNPLLTEIPSIWPVQGGLGRITMAFGRNVNPFTGLLYIHRGIDISTGRSGDPILAAADGQVVTVDFDPGFGNFLIIRHRHGYYTRYAHMAAFNVRIGQRVRQGEVIGFIGNTGLSTGPHLHFEVHIGSDVVNPYRYLNIRPRTFRPVL